MEWPEIFDQGIQDESDQELCAAGLSAWALVMCHERHPKFNDTMIAIGHRLGIPPTAMNLMEWSEKESKTR